MRQKPEPNHAQLALPLQRERRTRTPIPPFAYIDPRGEHPPYNGKGPKPAWFRREMRKGYCPTVLLVRSAKGIRVVSSFEWRREAA